MSGAGAVTATAKGMTKVAAPPRDGDGAAAPTSTSTRRVASSQFAHPDRHPSGEIGNYSHLVSCFVTFSSQSQATKCVKARSRAEDGIRAMHKYDYLKLEKRQRAAKMKGEVLSLTPTRTPLTGVSSSGAVSFCALKKIGDPKVYTIQHKKRMNVFVSEIAFICRQSTHTHALHTQ